jgi:hypothetical protein
MIPPRLTTSARVAQIRAAIVRVKQSEARVREISTDPSSDSSRTSTARAAHVFVIADFGWQWENVEAVLDALAPEKS